MYAEFKEKLSALPCPYQENEPMSRHTSFKIGGPADVLITPDSVETFRQVIRLCDDLSVPYFILGNGTNLLVADTGTRRAVLNTGGLKGLRAVGNTLTCGAGVKLFDACRAARDLGLAGLEFAYGIPGFCGGAAYMNAGAYGGEMKDVLQKCAHITKEGQLSALSGTDLAFAYRRSAYTDHGDVIVSLEMVLTPDDPAAIGARMEEWMRRRLEKQPYTEASAGSVFKRPPGYYAGTLIEQCGLKGRTVGGAAVSEKHAGFIVNRGGATAEDVRRLIDIIQREVYARSGVTLECEIKWVD